MNFHKGFFGALLVKSLLIMGAGHSFANEANEQAASKRIISVDANVTQVLLQLGLGKELVAAAQTSQGLLAAHGLTDLPQLGYHRNLSAEGLISLNPDLIIGSTHMGPPAIIEPVEKAGITLVRLEPAIDADSLNNNLNSLAALLGVEAEIGSLTARVSQQQQQLKALQTGADKPSMVFLLNMHSRGLSKAGVGTTGDALIRLVGGNNKSGFGGYKNISIEALMELDPDVILVGGRDVNTDAAAELLQNNPLLAYSSAAKNGKVFNVDSTTMIAGVSMGLMAEALRLSALIYQQQLAPTVAEK